MVVFRIGTCSRGAWTRVLGNTVEWGVKGWGGEEIG